MCKYASYLPDNLVNKPKKYLKIYLERDTKKYICLRNVMKVYLSTGVLCMCMKNVIKFLLLSPMAFSAVGCNAKQAKPVDVVVISGQSNAVGCTHSDCLERSMGYDKLDEYMAGYPGIQIAYDCWTKDVLGDGTPVFYSQNKRQDEKFFKVMLGQGNSEATFGPEIGIAEAMHEKYAGKLFLIKYACGASNLKDDWAQRNSPMYNRFVTYVKKQMDNLKSMGYKPTIKAFCWMQGEGDSYPGYYDKYYENLQTFVGNLRSDLKELSGNKDFPFIDAGINNSPQWEFYRQVNEAKKQFANDSDNNFYIDTIEAGMHTNKEPFNNVDTAHYDTESQVLLGHLFAEAFEPFLEKPEAETK